MTGLRLVGGKDLLGRAARERAFNQKVGARLRAWRDERGMSLAAMGANLGIVDTQVMRHESGATPLTCVRAARMCAILGHTMLELFA